MGICDSLKKKQKQKTEEKIETKELKQKNDPLDQTMEYYNLNHEEPNSNQSLVNNSLKGNASNQNLTNIEKPKLANYDKNVYSSGQKSDFSNNIGSLLSSSKSEGQEIIIKGNINNKLLYKEDDFINNSFKELVENNGGVVLKNNNSLCSSNNNKTNEENRNNNTLNNENLGIISGKYDNMGNLIHSNNNGITYNNELNMGSTHSSILSKINNYSDLAHSKKINVSLHGSTPKADSYLNVPKIDSPSPDINIV